MKHFASPAFWNCFEILPSPVKAMARKKYELLKKNSKHSSLHFKRIGRYYSVRVGRHYRALGVEMPDGVLWFWIGTHAEYDHLLP